jgi:DNA processing protein
MLASVEPDYPSGLAAIDPPPPLISVLGHVPLPNRDMVAMVGARNASALGIKFATRLAVDLGAGGLVVASGLARGIDHAAHRGAIETGTVAVLAGGVDIVYPSEHQDLCNAMNAQDVLVSEMR